MDALIQKTDTPYRDTGLMYSRPDDPTQIPGKLKEYDEQDPSFHEERRKTGLPDPYPPVAAMNPLMEQMRTQLMSRPNVMQQGLVPRGPVSI